MSPFTKGQTAMTTAVVIALVALTLQSPSSDQLDYSAGHVPPIEVLAVVLAPAVLPLVVPSDEKTAQHAPWTDNHNEDEDGHPAPPSPAPT